MICFCDNTFFIVRFSTQMILTCILIVENWNIRQSRYPLPSNDTPQGHISEEITVFILLFTLPDIKAYLGVVCLYDHVYLIKSVESYENNNTEEPIIFSRLATGTRYFMCIILI